MKILVSLTLFFVANLYGWTPPSAFNSTFIEIEESILSATIRGHYRDAESSLSKKTVREILSDKENRINDEFQISPYFKPAVKFWFSIYTQYTSEQVVIHDKKNLSLIYNVIDFSELHDHESIHRFSKAKLQTRLSKEYIKRLKKILKKLSTANLSRLNEEEDDVYNSLKIARIKLPKNTRKRKIIIDDLLKNIRTQTGQRNMIYNGILRSTPYFPYMTENIKRFKLPNELLSIPFLESSFNLRATSKVDAVGVWQFMPYIGNLFMPRMNNFTDYRRNPIVSSMAAFHLLKENKLILKRWDLAVTAYNSGPKHLKKAIRKLSPKRKRSRITLDYILQNYKHPHIGFASKNFYAEFLALVHTLAYKEMIYPLKGVVSKTPIHKPEDIKIYVSLCSIKPRSFFNSYRKSIPSLRKLNPQFKSIKKKYPRGSLVVSDKFLPKSKFFEVPEKVLRTRFPKNYQKYIKNKKCK